MLLSKSSLVYCWLKLAHKCCFLPVLVLVASTQRHSFKKTGVITQGCECVSSVLVTSFWLFYVFMRILQDFSSRFSVRFRHVLTNGCLRCVPCYMSIFYLFICSAVGKWLPSYMFASQWSMWVQTFCPEFQKRVEIGWFCFLCLLSDVGYVAYMFIRVL